MLLLQGLRKRNCKQRWKSNINVNVHRHTDRMQKWQLLGDWSLDHHLSWHFLGIHGFLSPYNKLMLSTRSVLVFDDIKIIIAAIYNNINFENLSVIVSWDANWFLKRGENWSTQRKTSQSRVLREPTNSTHTVMTPSLGIKPEPCWWEVHVSTLTTVPSLLLPLPNLCKKGTWTLSSILSSNSLSFSFSLLMVTSNKNQKFNHNKKGKRKSVRAHHLQSELQVP